MFTFREYVEANDVKKMVFNVLDPQRNSVDGDSKSILTRPLSDFKRRDDLLTAPGLADIINRSENRGSILQAIKNDSTTIGNLLSLLTQQEEEKELKYIG